MLVDTFFRNDTIDATSKISEVYIENTAKSCLLTKRELNTALENSVVKASLQAWTNSFLSFRLSLDIPCWVRAIVRSVSPSDKIGCKPV